MAGGQHLRKIGFGLFDGVASAGAVLASPIFRIASRRQAALPLYREVCDRLGYQVRSTHYYEPTYREIDLPSETDKPRSLPGLDLREAAQLALLARCEFGAELTRIPRTKTAAVEYAYNNGSFEHGDAEMLYNIIRLHRPQRIIEIGSGQSTLMARLAIAANRSDDPSYRCEHLCIEPYEAPWLEQVGVRVLRQRVEQVDLTLFDELQRNDILFIDSSHVIRPFGDVLFEFQEIVPRLADGVMVHVHDIFTPRDYPDSWLRSERKLWNEQYLLESFLAFNNEFHVVCANNYLKNSHFEEFVKACPVTAERIQAQPGSFWFRRGSS